MQQRRFTRLTNAFSKCVANLAHAVALYVTHYNLCRVHMSLRVTPAMQAGITDHVWSLEELIEAALSAPEPPPLPMPPPPAPPPPRSPAPRPTTLHRAARGVALGALTVRAVAAALAAAPPGRAA